MTLSGAAAAGGAGLRILAPSAFEAIAPEVPWDFSGFEKLLAAVESRCTLQERELGAQIACRAGCHHCCRRIPSILPVEWAWIRASELEKGAGGSVGGGALRSEIHPGEPLCAFLDAAGLCGIYGARPLICRTHGMLILSDEGLDHCPWNFQDLEEVDEEIVFRLENLHETLLRLNLAFLRASYPSDFAQLAGIRIEFQTADGC